MRPKYQMGKRAGAEGASIGMTAAPEEIIMRMRRGGTDSSV